MITLCNIDFSDLYKKGKRYIEAFHYIKQRKMLPTTDNSTITHSTCEISFEWKGGRRLANNENVAYILPSDKTEVDRLQLNHTLWK